MRAGKLRKRVVIQSKTPAQAADGQPVYTWGTYATVWASIEPATGREYLESTTQAQAVMHKVTIRYRDGITPEMRLAFTDRESSTRYFDIEAVLEPEIYGKELQLMCREMV
jgi:SPP1 family predicted phage head-tail adaptor